jgi:hypothetical protein
MDASTCPGRFLWMMGDHAYTCIKSVSLKYTVNGLELTVSSLWMVWKSSSKDGKS